MSYVLAVNGGASRAYVRACPPEQHFAYTSDPSAALKFASEADALAYLTAEHPIRKILLGNMSVPPGEGPIIGTFRRRSDFTHYALNIGEL